VRGDEDCIFVDIFEVFLWDRLESFISDLVFSKAVVGDPVHVDVLVRSGGSVIEEGQETCLVAHHSNPINIKYGSCDVGASNESSNLDRVSIFEVIEFLLEIFVVEVTCFRHRYHNNMGSALPPGNQICVVFEDGMKNYWLLRVDSEVLLVKIHFQFVNCSL